MVDVRLESYDCLSGTSDYKGNDHFSIAKPNGHFVQFDLGYFQGQTVFTLLSQGHLQKMLLEVQRYMVTVIYREESMMSLDGTFSGHHYPELQTPRYPK